MPDENDYMFTAYQLDFEPIIRFMHVHLWRGDGDISAIYDTLATWWYFYSIVAFMVSALLLVGIVYAKIRYAELAKIEQEQLRAAEHAYRHARGGTKENTKWGRVLAHVSSDNPSDWRLAIMEADIILDELLTSLGYLGTSIGDKLKGARPEIFASLQDAWDAHKVRNQIAHRGSDFVLTKRIAQDTVAQYRRVFEEFNFI